VTRIRTLLLLCLGALAAPAGLLAEARFTAPPVPGGTLRAGETVTLRFAVRDDAGADRHRHPLEETEILLSLDGGRSFPLRLTRERSAGTYSLAWRVPNLPTTRARLALRVGSEEEGEVVRDVSEEFAILADEGQPLEEVRPFRREWRTGEALDEVPGEDPSYVSDVRSTGETVRAIPPDKEVSRLSNAAPTGAPPDGQPEKVQAAPPTSLPPPPVPRRPLDLPRRE
jgi:hypothetical protein